VLAQLVDAGDTLWRADTLAQQAHGVVASGHALLDAQLPGGGWPLGGLCDILQHPGSHREWQLLAPALAAAQAGGAGATVGAVPDTLSAWVALIGAPYTPFGPGLAARELDVTRLLWVQADTAAERLWAVEQVLRCSDVAAVLVWLGQVSTTALRRLQMAAHTHTKLLFALRPASARAAASPAVLRLLLLPDPASGGLRAVRAGHTAQVVPGSRAAQSQVVTPFEEAADAGSVGLTSVLRVELLKRRGPSLADPLTLPVVGSVTGWMHALDRFAA